MADPTAPQNTEEPTLTLIQQIKDGSRSAKLLGKEQRQQCIVLLRTAGSSYAYLAQFLCVSEKTIQRDVREIRARNKADPPSEELARQLIGEYLTWMETHHTNLVRAAQDKSISAEGRILAETNAARLLDDMMARLQGCGYLPQQVRHVVGDVTHHLQDEDGPDALQRTEELLALIECSEQEQSDARPDILDAVHRLREQLSQAKLAAQAKALLTQQQLPTTKEESHD